jgi:hypothetical protein
MEVNGGYLYAVFKLRWNLDTIKMASNGIDRSNNALLKAVTLDQDYQYERRLTGLC